MSKPPELFPPATRWGTPIANPPSGEQLKAEAFETLLIKHDQWIHYARDQAAHWLSQQPAGTTITSDDIWERWPPPNSAHPSVMGPVFRDRRFKAIGYQKSRRASAHARVISVYGRGDL